METGDRVEAGSSFFCFFFDGVDSSGEEPATRVSAAGCSRCWKYGTNTPRSFSARALETLKRACRRAAPGREEAGPRAKAQEVRRMKRGRKEFSEILRVSATIALTASPSTRCTSTSSRSSSSSWPLKSSASNRNSKTALCCVCVSALLSPPSAPPSSSSSAAAAAGEVEDKVETVCQAERIGSKRTREGRRAMRSERMEAAVGWGTMLGCVRIWSSVGR
mmetsp:Transcript_7739/g.10458  ORF Transcript_7739/g.10458 Transcript_7739/m.10458 type:complete len:220 (+) Transcript_7739:565-1224(+)